MVEHADVDQCQRLPEALGDADIGLAGFADTGRMVVREDHRCGIVGERLLDHFARVDAGAIDGAAEHFAQRDHAVAVVEHQAGEDFVLVVAQLRLQVTHRLRRARQAIAAREIFGEVAPRDFECGLQQHELGGAEALATAQAVAAGVEYAAQRAEIGDQSAREVDRGQAGYAGA